MSNFDLIKILKMINNDFFYDNNLINIFFIYKVVNKRKEKIL